MKGDIFMKRMVDFLRSEMRMNMNDAMTLMCSISNSCLINAQQNQGNSMMTGVDMNTIRYDFEKNHKILSIPVRVRGFQYELDPVEHKIKTANGKLYMKFDKKFSEKVNRLFDDIATIINKEEQS